MKLLIVTQTLDVNDTILGFFVRWVKEFADHCEVVHILALNVGTYDLPPHVHVHCLGKSEGRAKIVWLLRLWRYSWSLRREYDSVFVHMNPEYTLLGGPLWRLLRKRVGLWYAHGTVSLKLRLALWWSHIVFTSTDRGMRIDSPKRAIVGQGIDTDHFKPDPTIQKNPNQLSLIIVGRISPSKGFETLLGAVALLKEKGLHPHFSIYGKAQNELEEAYTRQLEVIINDLGIEQEVEFCGSISQNDLPGALNRADVFIHDGRTGSLDKVLLEAVACGVTTISSNPAFGDFVGAYTCFMFKPGNIGELAKQITYCNDVDHNVIPMMKELREQIIVHHNLEQLVGGILKTY